jgi:enoyl-CoA hydratase/carnithine racemase
VTEARRVEDLVYGVDPDAHVAEVVIDRPEARNAFTAGMWTAATELLEDAAADDSVSTLLLRATSTVFCAGADVREVRVGDDASRPFRGFVTAIEAFPKPLVAAVQGAAVGGGFTMLAYADVVLVAPEARFRAPFVEMGLVPEAGSSLMLPALVGPRAAAELVLTARWMGAEEAHRVGFATEVVAADELGSRARDVAARIAAMPLPSLVATKALLRHGRRHVEEVRARESAAFQELLAARPGPRPDPPGR